MASLNKRNLNCHSIQRDESSARLDYVHLLRHALHFALRFCCPGTDETINAKRPRFNQTVASAEFLPIYADSIQRVGTTRYDAETLELMKRVQGLKAEGYAVDSLANGNLLRWDSTLFEGTDLDWQHYSDNEIADHVSSLDFDYVLASSLDPHLLNQDGHTYLGALTNMGFPEEEVFTNGSGTICKVVGRVT